MRCEPAIARYFYLPAMLHAAVRSEKNRNIKPNDVFNFRHAAAALPYCAAYFADGPLSNLPKSGQMGLGAIYGCELASTPTEATATLKHNQGVQ